MKLRNASVVFVMLAMVLVMVITPMLVSAEAPHVNSVPRVVGTTPKDNSVNVSVNQTINIRFSDDMDIAATKNAISITPIVRNNVTCIDGAFFTTECTMTASLNEGTTYNVAVSTNAKNNLGTHMASPYHFQFTTVSSPTPLQQISSFLQINWLILIIIILIVALIIVYYRMDIRKKLR